MEKYENKKWDEVIGSGDFPAPISLHQNIDYVRKILGDTVQFTNAREGYEKIKELPEDADFFRFQKTINPNVNTVPSHNVIDGFIKRRGVDYRYQVALSPVPELRNRREDNTSVGRKPNAAPSTAFFCNE